MTKVIQTAWVLGLLFCATPHVLASELQAGFGHRVITPVVHDSWTDLDNNAQFDEDLDDWIDGNSNGKFDPVWMAGFQNQRPAQGVRDDLMSVAVAIDDGNQRIGIVTADTVGLMRQFVLALRAEVPAAWGLDYVMVHATHNHEGPDTQGLWGPGNFSSGVDPAYLSFLREQMLATLGDAVAALEPARLQMASIPNRPETPVTDVRKPIVIDDNIRSLLFRRGDGSVIGTLVNFGIHVELAWDRNLELTADVAGYLRRGLDQGIVYDGKLMRPGLGGTTMWLTGNIGGLMTSGPGDPVHDIFLHRDIEKAGDDKARAFGYGLADTVLTAFERGDFHEDASPKLRIHHRELELGIDNFLLSLATVLGIVDSDPQFHFTPPFIRYQTEVSHIALGSATITGVPGELYPEIAMGGIENPPGADYAVEPQEVPPLRSQFDGRVNLMVNLANDAIGYIIPKSEWDSEEPWIYDYKEETYGEAVSLGANTAPAVHAAVVEAANANQGTDK